MNLFERAVRGEVFNLFVGGIAEVDAAELSRSRGWNQNEVATALESLEAQHRILLVAGTHRVLMAHPFAGLDTGYQAHVDTRSWFANCAWDALAIVALLGNGNGRATGRDRAIDWSIEDGRVTPNGIVHHLVPPRHFWDDIVFTCGNIHGFRSDAELAEWLEETGHQRGYAASAQTMYDLAIDWYAGRLDEEWNPPDATEAEAIFIAHGLNGEFWRLTGD